ncbi:MAG: 6-pyruvoyl-tetrahydropterin synthase-related protein, partial [Patescibacteria group bacterium]
MMIANLKREFAFLVTLTILACILVIDAWLFSSQPQTFDGWAHLVTMDSFAQSIRAGSLPVSWSDSVANYGYPLGQIAHQTTNYLGAVFFLITGNIITAYNILLTFILVSTVWAMYAFLRLYVGQWPAFAGAALFNVAPYRFLNTYIRGALPELIAPLFILLTLIGLVVFFERKKRIGLPIMTAGMAGLVLTHPMIFFIAVPLIAGMFIWFFWKNRSNFRFVASAAVFLFAGVLIGGYYLLPLVLELKYFYQGSAQNQIGAEQYLGVKSLITERWEYFDPTTTGIRENRLQFGFLEFVIMFTAFVLLFLKKNFYSDRAYIAFWLGLFVLILAMALPVSKFLYDNVPLLSSIQFPWRWLSLLQLFPPILLALLFARIKYVKAAIFLLILFIALVRIPQTYSKNFVLYPPERYSQTSVNIHSTTMNTIWSGVTTEYPQKEVQSSIIAGDGEIELLNYTPTKRQYRISAKEPVRIAEYTFYFPGWEVYA